MIKFNQFKEIIKENSVRADSLFHYSLHWMDILDSGKLNATKLVASDMDAVARVMEPGGGRTIDMENWGYVSMARSLASRYIPDWEILVAMEFDRNKLKQRYMILPIEYWYNKHSASKRSKNRSEKEDRVISKNGPIPVKPYLTGVHILVADAGEDTHNVHDWKMKKIFGYVENLVDKYPDVPFYMYHKLSHWRAKRFAEADQLNPHLPDYEGDDD